MVDKQETSADRPENNGADGVEASRSTKLTPAATVGQQRQDAERIRELFENAKDPYRTKMSRKAYERHKAEMRRVKAGR